MLTRESILAMEPKELKRHIAEFMGYTVYHYDKDVEENCYFMLVDPTGDYLPFERKTEEEAWDDAPDFPTDISAAIEVAEKFPTYQVTKLHDVELPWSKEEMYRAIIKQNKNVAHARTAPLAICRAALLTTISGEDDKG